MRDGCENMSGIKLSKLEEKAFNHWKICIHSGLIVKIHMIKGFMTQIGFCVFHNRDVDFIAECLECKKHQTKRRPPKHQKTATMKAKIARGRQRAMKRKKDGQWLPNMPYYLPKESFV